MTQDPPDRPARFYDNRQNYLTFVTTCDEKWQVAERAIRELPKLKPKPPAVRVFDAGIGDGTVLAHLLRGMHTEFTSKPFFVVGKEISLEDVRLFLDKVPDRFVEHPQMVMTVTNLHYAEAPLLTPNTAEKRERMNFHYVELTGDCSHGFGEQLRDLDDFLVDAWSVKASEKTGNPLYANPTALVLYREDQRFALDNVIPRKDQVHDGYDLILASQPWRSRTGAEFKASRILAPLARTLRSHGTLLGIQSAGGDPGMEIIHRMWPDEMPFPVDRHELIEALRKELGGELRNYDLMALPEDESKLTYSMHTLPPEIGNHIGTSTLYAAWNAAIYVAQMEHDRVETATVDGNHLEATAAVLHEQSGLWFNDETFVVRRL